MPSGQSKEVLSDMNHGNGVVISDEGAEPIVRLVKV